MTTIEVSTDRIAASNAVLAILTKNTSIHRVGGHIFVAWSNWGCAEKIVRRWQCRGQDFYPVWYRRWGHGGTCCTALAQLVRWSLGKTCLPLSTWKYWATPTVYLGRERGPEIVEILRAAGYPESTPCVLCGRELSGSLDWWSLKKVVGPCCSMHDIKGCQQGRKS